MTDPPPKPNKRISNAANRAAQPVTIADWTLGPPANTHHLADPFADPERREDANLGSAPGNAEPQLGECPLPRQTPP